MKCPDCKGTGKYIGLNVVETCRTCKGLGVVNPTGRLTVEYGGKEVWRGPDVPADVVPAMDLQGTQSIWQRIKDMQRLRAINDQQPTVTFRDCYFDGRQLRNVHTGDPV
jgi:RecJ-like exonuclease